jgi:hypothetical protein
MTSAINPNNIDNAYPIAGQDNDSQGFRDNFTNIKTNFQYAAQELTDLQNKVVLKAALTGTTLNNDMGQSLLSAAKIQNFTATRVDFGALSGTVTVNYQSGHYQILTMTGSVTLAFTNFPAAGSTALVRVRVSVPSTSYTLTLPAAVSIGTTNLQGYSGSVITFNQTGTYEYEFVTIDGGASISIFDLNRNRDPIFLPSYEDLAASASASLTTTTSLFTTSAGETATLAAGYEGQVKVFAATDVTLGNMVITVTNAGWKASGSGTITFASRGSAVTLLYVNAKWYCIGNNGATFG